MTGRPAAPRFRCGRASLLLAIFVAGCTGAPLVASAPPFGVVTGTPADQLPAGVTVEDHEASYPIAGDSAAALVEAMAARGLRDEAGDAAWALTTWDIAWSYQYVARQDGAAGLATSACRSGSRS